MLNFIKKLTGWKTTDFKNLLASGAQIVDVRTPEEYRNGHIKNSVNIPLQQLNAEIDKLDLQKPVITCCASGMRSASAKAILTENGFEAYNGGGWASLKDKLYN